MLMKNRMSTDFGSKVVLLGNSGAGKTSILQYQLVGKSSSNLQSTIGCQFNDIIVHVRENDSQSSSNESNNGTSVDNNNINSSTNNPLTNSTVNNNNTSANHNINNNSNNNIRKNSFHNENNDSSTAVVLKVWDTAGQEVYRSIVPVYVRDSAAAILVYDVSDQKSFDALDLWRNLLLGEQTENVKLYIVANKIDLNDVVGEENAQIYAARVHAALFRVCAMDGTGVRELFNQIAKDVGSKKTFVDNLVENDAKNDKECC